MAGRRFSSWRGRPPCVTLLHADIEVPAAARVWSWRRGKAGCREVGGDPPRGAFARWPWCRAGGAGRARGRARGGGGRSGGCDRGRPRASWPRRFPCPRREDLNEVVPVVALVALLALSLGAIPAAGAPARTEGSSSSTPSAAGSPRTTGSLRRRSLRGGRRGSDDLEGGAARRREGGTNPATGEPAFARTLGQEGAADNPFGLPGGIDHVKWLYYINRTNAETGQPGFKAPTDGRELVCAATIGGRTTARPRTRSAGRSPTRTTICVWARRR